MQAIIKNGKVFATHDSEVDVSIYGEDAISIDISNTADVFADLDNPEDMRGTVYWTSDGELKIVDSASGKVPEGAFTEIPKSAIDANNWKKKEKKLLAIETESGMPRALRELILDNEKTLVINSAVLSKARKVEDSCQAIRKLRSE